MDAIPTTSGLAWQHRAALLLLSAAVLVPGTFTLSLTDRDEGWYAQVAREMQASGDWAVPTYLGQPWLAKPPLLYWCVAASFELFGRSAGAARLPSVLAMLTTVQVLATLGTRLLGRRAALFAAAVFITAGLPALVGRMVLTDALLVLCCTAAAERMIRCVQAGTTPGRAVMFWLWVGLGVLAKGPAILLFSGGLAVGLYRYAGADWRRAAMRFALAAPIALLVAVPWYVIVAFRAGDVLGAQFLGQEIVDRFANPPHGHVGPPGYHVLVALAGWLPWTALVPGAVIAAWRERRICPEVRALLWWSLLPWAFLELVPSKLPHYALPCYVPLALLVGRMWANAAAQPLARPAIVGLSLWTGTLIVSGAALIGCALAVPNLPGPWGVGLAGGVLIVGFAGVLHSGISASLRRGFVVACMSMVMFDFLVAENFLRELEPQRLSRGLAETANEVAGTDARIVVCGYDEPTLFFYLDRPAVLARPATFKSALYAEPRPTVLIVTERIAREAGLHPEDAGIVWRPISGVNYVKGEPATVWVVGPFVPRPASDS